MANEVYTTLGSLHYLHYIGTTTKKVKLFICPANRKDGEKIEKYTMAFKKFTCPARRPKTGSARSDSGLPSHLDLIAVSDVCQTLTQQTFNWGVRYSMFCVWKLTDKEPVFPQSLKLRDFRKGCWLPKHKENTDNYTGSGAAARILG